MRAVCLASGSEGNCTLVSDGNKHILIDAGISTKRIRAGLSELSLDFDSISALLITHTHADHISALPVLMKQSKFRVFATRSAANELCRSIAGIEDRIKELCVGASAEVGGFGVTPFSTSHDAPGSVGYRVAGSTVLGFCTDLGVVTDEIKRGMTGCELAIIEANHDVDMLRFGPYPVYLKRRILSDTGHLSNASAAELALFLASSGARYIALAHLSRTNNLPSLARRTVEETLLAERADIGGDLVLSVAEPALLHCVGE